MSEPYFTNDHIRVYLGESIKILDEFIAEGRHFDLLLTDPPCRCPCFDWR